MRQETLSREATRDSALVARPGTAALYAIVVLVVGAAAVRALVHAHEDRMQLSTGDAEWIWYARALPQPRLLQFYATRDFALPAPPTRAAAKLFVDRSHVLYVNGTRVGSGTQSPGDPLALYDVARLLEPGINRVTIEASSPTGVGGILFALDLDGYGRNALVSDRRWRVDLSSAAISAGARFQPIVWGRPPQYPWKYPRMPRPEELGGNLR